MILRCCIWLGTIIALISPSMAHPPWQSISFQGTPDPPLAARAVRVFERLRTEQPIGLLDMPGRGQRLLLETAGKLKVFDATTEDPEQTTLSLDLAQFGEPVASVRDMTLDPDFENNGYIYLVWGIKPHFVDGGTRVSRFTIPDEPEPVIDIDSRLDVITYPSGDHCGASLRFGPDGYLYIGTGDGSGPNPPDVHRTSQDLTDLRGSILRIDVSDSSKASPYRVPDDNPFVGEPWKQQGVRPEIYSYGVRNAFRLEFDPKQGNLWVADVGWVRCEMLHHTFAGANHGWSLYEGPHPVDPAQPQGPGDIIAPALAIPRAEAQSITGGVFQAVDSDFYPGRYLFGDFMNGAVWAADLSDPKRVTYEKVADTSSKIVSFAQIRFGQDSLQTPIAIDHRGRFLRLEGIEETSDANILPPFPRKLSETGLYQSIQTLEPAEGATRYRPAATMWRDGATGDRIVAIPMNEPIKANRNRRNYVYPPGTVFANTISQDVLTQDDRIVARRMETQVLSFDGFNWRPYTYRWNDEQDDAELVPAYGEETTIRVADRIHGSSELVYRYLSRDQCRICHHAFHAGAMSFLQANLTGKSGSTRWADLAKDGWVTSDEEPRRFHVDSYDESESLEVRARSYLDMNCATCHAPAGAGLSKLNLMFENTLEKTASVDEPPLQGTFGLDDARVIVAGHPERSVLMYRMATSGGGRMPHVGSGVPDNEAAKMVWDWIASMKAAPTKATELQSPAKPSTSFLLNAWHELLSAEPETAQQRVGERMKMPHSSFEDDLLAPWIEPTARKKSIGNNPDVGEILQLAGDAKLGASWWADASGAQCRSCHRKNGVGIAVGPDLDGVGRRQGRGQLLRSLLFPSETIDPFYQSRTYLLDDGSAVTGFLVSEIGQSTTIKTSDGTLRSIDNDTIEVAKENPQSIMPAGQLSSLTAQQVADLLEYLMK
jgi:putative heme-binding domain-containing protein